MYGTLEDTTLLQGELARVVGAEHVLGPTPRAGVAGVLPTDSRRTTTTPPAAAG